MLLLFVRLFGCCFVFVLVLFLFISLFVSLFFLMWALSLMSMVKLDVRARVEWTSVLYKTTQIIFQPQRLGARPAFGLMLKFRDKAILIIFITHSTKSSTDNEEKGEKLNTADIHVDALPRDCTSNEWAHDFTYNFQRRRMRIKLVNLANLWKIKSKLDVVRFTIG